MISKENFRAPFGLPLASPPPNFFGLYIPTNIHTIIQGHGFSYQIVTVPITAFNYFEDIVFLDLLHQKLLVPSSLNHTYFHIQLGKMKTMYYINQ